MNENNGFWVIVLSFFCACLLAIFPLPYWAELVRPEWTALVLVFWLITVPQRVGIYVAFGVGLLLDAIEGAVPGQNALSFTLLAAFLLLLYQRLRVATVWQQSATVLVLLGLHQLWGLWVQNLSGTGNSNSWFLLPALSGAVLWPGVLVILRHQCRVHNIQ